MGLNPQSSGFTSLGTLLAWPSALQHTRLTRAAAGRDYELSRGHDAAAPAAARDLGARRGDHPGRYVPARLGSSSISLGTHLPQAGSQAMLSLPCGIPSPAQRVSPQSHLSFAAGLTGTFPSLLEKLSCSSWP